MAQGREPHISCFQARPLLYCTGELWPHVEWFYRDRAALGHSQELPEADRIDVSFDRILEGRFIIGSPAECVDEIKKYQELGVEELVLRCQWPGMPNEDSLEAVELFGREVLPRFQ